MSARAVAWAWEQDVPANEKIVLLAYADQARDDGAAQLAQGDIAAMVGASVRAVRGNVARLEERELAKRHPRQEYGARIADVVKLAVDGSVELPSDFAEGRPAGFAGETAAAASAGRQHLPGTSSSSPETIEGGRRRGRQDLPGGPTDVPEGTLADAQRHLDERYKVASRLVTPEEMRKAAAALAAFNRAGDTDYGLGGHLTKLVGRIRDRPSWDEEKLVRLVESAWRLRWWEKNGKGRRPSPSVVFGNSDVFEAVAQEARDEAAGTLPPDEERVSRFARSRSVEDDD